MSAASKANKQATSYFALTFKTVKLLRFITKYKTVEWHGGEAWKGNKVLLKTYRPHDVLTVSELKKTAECCFSEGQSRPSGYV
jgi:hypothetical protein